MRLENRGSCRPPVHRYADIMQSEDSWETEVSTKRTILVDAFSHSALKEYLNS